MLLEKTMFSEEESTFLRIFVVLSPLKIKNFSPYHF